MRDRLEFLRQSLTRFETTGAVAPSSRFLAKAVTEPLRHRDRPARVLEVGPGTGAVTRKIVRMLRPEDHFDLVEPNQAFAEILRDRFESDTAWRRVAPQSQIHVRMLQDLQTEAPYDFIISGLPLNNFPPNVVRGIFEQIFSLLAPCGVVSYFEYMYVRPIRRVISKAEERQRLNELDRIADDYCSRFRMRRDSVWLNIPPAWVQHLRHHDDNRIGADRTTGAVSNEQSAL